VDEVVRRLFVETVAFLPPAGKVLGDGAVFRACREVLRDAHLISEETQK
jgi:hypothetical protein